MHIEYKKYRYAGPRAMRITLEYIFICIRDLAHIWRRLHRRIGEFHFVAIYDPKRRMDVFLSAPLLHTSTEGYGQDPCP